MKPKLRDYQEQCKQAFYSHYRDSMDNGVIVVPTAGGKSLLIGSIISEISQKFPDVRILLLSHVQELIKQNSAKIKLFWESAPVGIYSASLKKKQAHYPIVAATIQSVHRKAIALGHRDILLIDEAHLINSEDAGMYRRIIRELHSINPKMIVCGMTATDYRTDSGLLTEGDNALFKKTIIEITLSYLLEQGYLCPPISKASLVQADMSEVTIQNGDFNKKEMAGVFDQKEFTEAAVESDMQFFEGRKCIASFCCTVEHAQHVAEAMNARGLECEVIHGEMAANEREDKLQRFASGQLRALASVGVLTTGTDIPSIDCIILFRATESPGLLQQIVGRGFRVIYADGYDLETREGRIAAIANGVKPNFLILDHGGNIERHGGVTHIQKPKARKKGERRKLIKTEGRICEVCRSWWPMEVIKCQSCGNQLVNERDVTAKLSIEASHADILGTPFSRGEKAEWFNVDHIGYAKHTSKEGKQSLKITYLCGIQQFNEWKNINYIKDWWQQRATVDPVPRTIEQALELSNTLEIPKKIQVIKKNKYFEVLRYEF